MKQNKKKLKLKKKVKRTLVLSFIFFIILMINFNKLLLKTLTKYGNESINSVFFEVDDEIAEYKSTKSKSDTYDEIFKIREEKNTNPIVYLYNTHQGEKYFKNDVFEPSIITATNYLKEKLNNLNINTIMEKRSVSDVLSQNGWSYGSSYRVSRSFLESTKNEFPTIKYYFDIHRDAGKKESTTLCVNDKCYAKLLFLVGLENPNYAVTEEYAENLSARINNKLKGLSKGIIQKQGQYVNGVYNEDFSNRLILIEVGGENNTIEEVYNTVDILSEVISDFIREDET